MKLCYKIKIIFLSLIFFTECFSQDLSRKEISVSVDDLPYVSKYYNDVKYGKMIIDSLLSAFREFNIKALGAVNTSKLYELGRLNYSKLILLERWLDSGMLIANHTHSHKNIFTITVQEYCKDVIEGESILKDLLKDRNQKLKYFRHPYLLRGENKEKADSLSNFLKERGYIEAPVTIDNYDYLFSLALEKALIMDNDTLISRIGCDYIKYMEDVLKYYESQSIALFGYNIKHILILHANLINAYFIRNLLNMYVKNNYTFISIDEALTDNCYQSKDEFYKNSGVSWLHRWAWSMGFRKDFFDGEPDIPEYIKALIKN